MINKINIKLAYIWSTRPKANLLFFTNFLGFLGVVIGVSTLVIVMSVMNGFKDSFEKNIKNTSSDIMIYPVQNKFINDNDIIINKIKNLNYIKNITNTIQGECLIISKYNKTGVIFSGNNIDGIKNNIINNIISGDIKNLSDNSIIIGYELAKILEVGINDKVRIMLPNVNNVIIGSIPITKELKVISIYHTGIDQYDSNNVIINYNLSSKLLDSNNKPNIIEINLKDHYDLKKSMIEIEKKIYIHKLHIKNWETNNKEFLNGLKTERVAMFCILSLIVIVAMFNVLLSQVMCIKEHKSDIAILRSFGTKKSDILISFIMYNMYIGILGVITGLAVGYIISDNIEYIKQLLEYFSFYNVFDPIIYFLSYLPSKIMFFDLIVISGMTLSMCFLGSIYPAYYAANISVVEAIRYE